MDEEAAGKREEGEGRREKGMWKAGKLEGRKRLSGTQGLRERHGFVPDFLSSR